MVIIIIIALVLIFLLCVIVTAHNDASQQALENNRDIDKSSDYETCRNNIRRASIVGFSMDESAPDKDKKCPVKKILETTYEDARLVKSKIIKGKMTWAELSEYDRDGNLLRTCNFASDGKAFGNQYIEQKNISGNRTVIETKDANNKLRSRSVLDHDDKVIENCDSSLREEIAYDKDGHAVGIRQYLIDTDGKETLAFESETKYNASGREVEYTEHDYSGHEDKTFSYEYQKTADGKVLKKCIDHTDNSVSVTMNSSEEQGRHGHQKISVDYDKDGREQSRIVDYYDEFGNLVSNRLYVGEELYGENEWRYEYDRYGNWTNCLHRMQDKGAKPKYSVTERDIEYWK